MQAMSDAIADYIEQQLDATGGAIELRRNEVAVVFGCTPSQITYVLQTRFTLIQGYRIESRRGGGGFVRIWRLSAEEADGLGELVRAKLNEPMSSRQAQEIVEGLVRMGTVDRAAGRLMISAISEEALRGVERRQAAAIRSRVLRQMLMNCFFGKPGNDHTESD